MTCPVAALGAFLDEHPRLVVLTGAGCSTGRLKVEADCASVPADMAAAAGC